MSEPEAPAAPARPPQITAAIIAAMKAVSSVGKNGYNTDQRFKYRKYDDIITVANAALVESGVAITPTVIGMDRSQREVTTKSQARRTVTTTVVHMRYKLTCAADGSSEVIDWYGEASDYGDKSLGKAKSYAAKMMLIDLLKIPVDDPDADADGHSHAEDAPATAPAAPPPERTGRRRQSRTTKPQRPAVPAPPAESDPALMEDIITRLAPFHDDPFAAGDLAELERVWGDVQRGRDNNKWSVDDYNTICEHVRLIKHDIKERTEADLARTRTHTPKPTDPDPWADAPVQEPATGAPADSGEDTPHPFAGLPGRDQNGDRTDAPA